MKNYFKTLLMSQTSRDSVISLAGNFGMAVFGTLFSVLVARAISLESFGIFSALVALYTMLSSLGDMGISGALVNFVPKLKNTKELVSTAFWLQIVIGIFLALIAQIKLIPNVSHTQLLITGIITGVFIMENFLINLLRSQRRFALATILILTDSFIKLVLLGALFIGRYTSIEVILVAGLASGTIATVIGLLNEQKYLGLIFSFEKLKDMFSFTKWIAVVHLFSVAVGRIDVLLLISLSSASEAGLFSVASRMILLFTLIISSLSMVTAPRFSGFTSINQVKNYIFKIGLMVCGITIAMLVFIPLTSLLVNLIFGAKYILAIPIFQYLILANIPFLFSLVVANPLIYYFNEPKWVAGSTLIQVIILIALDCLLIPYWGAFGAVIGIGVAQTTVLLILGGRLWQKLRLTV